MFVRVLAVLVTLGLLVGSFETASARTLTSAPAPTTALVDDGADDPADITLVLPPLEPTGELQPPQLTSFAVDAPPHHQPCTIVFRPPRAYAFN